MDVPYCRRPDRNDLLHKHIPETLCGGSVLHMLLVDVYYAMEELGLAPALLYGSMLGAVRDESVIPFTEDVDLGYQIPVHHKFYPEVLRDHLHSKGYHMFYDGIWRVCVGPHHTLASNIYSPDSPLSRAPWLMPTNGMPYLDLYKISETWPNYWNVQFSDTGATPIYGRPKQDYMPYAVVRVNDMEFNTLAKPAWFLEQYYGKDFRKEKPTQYGKNKNLPTSPV